jgi:hypothetical protein
MFMLCSEMADGAPSLTTAPTDACPGDGGEARRLTERQIEALGELVEIGLKIARAIERQVDGPEPLPAADLNAVAIAFARVARAVRQTVMLQSKLQDERNAATAKAGDVRVRVAGIVRRAIEHEHGDAERAERLAAEAAERLEQERYGDLLTRPIREIVADICKDLGLDPDWNDLFDEISAAEAFARGGAEAAAAPAEQGPVEVRWLDEEELWGDSS